MTDLTLQYILLKEIAMQKSSKAAIIRLNENSIYTAVNILRNTKYTKIIFLDADGDHNVQNKN